MASHISFVENEFRLTSQSKIFLSKFILDIYIIPHSPQNVQHSEKYKKNIHYGIGACANLDSDYAINKSLKECLFTYFYSLNIMDVRQDNPNKIKTLYEHFLYYQGNNFENLLFDSKKINYKKETITFNSLIMSLQQNDISVYYKELTTDDIKSTGIKVVKVIAPSLIDLNKSHLYPRLGATRFFVVPQNLGLKYNEKLTDMPHPFP